ncbi:hypothetical protein VKS41_002730 [Umbelopsis sp. WA50703]
MSENQVASSFSFKIFERIKPDEYFRRFIEENVRPDGRALHTFRPTSIRQGAITTANGSAMVRIGGTTVVCGIKAEVAEPRVDRPKDGYLVPNVELSPICSANFRPGPPSEQAQVNAEIINQVLINCDIVDLADLCIEEGKAVWSLYADIVCINYDGNILDASFLALVCALKDLSLPTATVLPSSIVQANSSMMIKPLNMRRIPISSTFCIFANPKVTLSDPTDSEENLSKETVSIILDTDGKILYVHKSGGAMCDVEMMKNCFSRANERAAELRELIERTSTQ